MQDLINRLKSESHAKPSPGLILCTLAEDKLRELIVRYPNHNSKALWIGAYLADLFLTEAHASGDISLHIPMALDYAKKIIQEEGISEEDAEIILELISTHHGGEQKHLESKLFKNADCFKFLPPRGVFHLFGAFYKDEKDFDKVMTFTMSKVEEKYSLVDLDDELKAEAKELYDHWQYFFDQVGVDPKTPDLYMK